jgi:catechol 2,3-dioxygenase-like lactoylglutathione lyase family enzyme
MAAKLRINHIGHAVADLERARRFWVEAFDFETARELEAPDEGTSQLLGIPPPVGLHAVYLRREDFVLELLHFSGAGLKDRPARVMNEPGFTHISLLVDDLDARLVKVRALGGTVLEETRVGDFAIMVLDPDGQRVELLTNWEKPEIPI